MANKGVYLTLRPELHTRANEKAKRQLMTIQEYIYDLLRKDLLAPPQQKSKAGRPKKNEDAFLDMFSRKR